MTFTDALRTRPAGGWLRRLWGRLVEDFTKVAIAAAQRRDPWQSDPPREFYRFPPF